MVYPFCCLSHSLHVSIPAPGYARTSPRYLHLLSAFSKGAEQEQTTLKNTFLSFFLFFLVSFLLLFFFPSPQHTLGCLHLPVLESPLRKKLFPAGAEWGMWAGDNAVKIQTKQRGRVSVCLSVCWGSVRSSQYRTAGALAVPCVCPCTGEQTLCLG